MNLWTKLRPAYHICVRYGIERLCFGDGESGDSIRVTMVEVDWGVRIRLGINVLLCLECS